MKKYYLKSNSAEIPSVEVDSVELKCLLVSRGVKAAGDFYSQFSDKYRLNANPLTCNCMILPDGTIAQLTDVSFHLRYLTGVLKWSNLKLLKYAARLGTPFSLVSDGGKPALLYGNEFVAHVSFPAKTDFYSRKTSSGRPFIGNAVIQGYDWVAYQCLWPCEYAAKGKPCEYCFSGAEFETLAKKNKPLPDAFPAADAAEIAAYAVKNAGVTGAQLTGGSTFDGKAEAEHIRKYLEAFRADGDIKLPCGVLLYITPPEDFGYIGEYFSLGAEKIACSLEVWDTERAKVITPGKIFYTTREKYLKALEYTAEKYGANKAFSNFIIGLEETDTLFEGAEYLAQRGIIPSASVWMPMGRPVMGSMAAPDADYYRRVKEKFAELYVKYGLDPAGCRGLNVCIERDIRRYANGE